MENDKYIDSLLKQASNKKETEIPLSLNNKIKDTINNLPNKNVKYRRNKYIATAVMLILIFSSTALILTKPAFAEEIVAFNTIYEKLGYYKEYKEFSSYIGESKEYKGYKITIEDLVMTKNKLMVSIKLNSNKPFKSEDKETSIAHNVGLYFNFKNMKIKSTNGLKTVNYIDETTAVIVYEVNIYGDEFKKRGDIKLMLRPENQDLEQIRADFDLKVDFTKAFNNSMNVKVDKMIKTGDGSVYIKELQATPLGTEVAFSINNIEDNKFDLDIDGEIYTYFNWNNSDGTCHAEFKGLNYNVVKNAKSINVIPIYKENESKIEEGNTNYNVVNINEDSELPFKPNFIDGNNGEVYKIERVKDNIRLYYDCGENTLGELSTMIFRAKEQSPLKRIIKKDKDRKNGYYAEVKVDKNKKYTIWKTKKNGLYKSQNPIKIK